MSVFPEIDESSRRGEIQGSTYFTWSITLFVMSSLRSPQESPRREMQVRRGRRRPASNRDGKRKMLFEFLDAVPRHEVVGVVVDVAG